MAGIVALAPITMHPEFVPEEFKPNYTAYVENAAGPLIDRAAMYVFNGTWKTSLWASSAIIIITAINGCDNMKDDPYVFPALHPRKSELPPVYISTCGADPLRDDGTIYKIELDKFGWVESYLSFIASLAVVNLMIFTALKIPWWTTLGYHISFGSFQKSKLVIPFV